MPTQPYVPFNPDLPDTASASSRQDQLDAVRFNFQAIRDWLSRTGKVPGFNCAPLGGPALYPSGVLHTAVAGDERIKEEWAWTNGRIVKTIFYYSTDAGSTWVPLTNLAGNYVETDTYDASGYWAGTTEGNAP